MHIKDVYRLHSAEDHALETDEERAEEIGEANVIEQATRSHTFVINHRGTPSRGFSRCVSGLWTLIRTYSVPPKPDHPIIITGLPKT